MAFPAIFVVHVLYERYPFIFPRIDSLSFIKTQADNGFRLLAQVTGTTSSIRIPCVRDACQTAKTKLWQSMVSRIQEMGWIL